MTVQSDRELVVRSSAGDRDAFATLVERYQRLVFGVAVAITRDRATAEDVGQDTFVAAWRGLAGLADRGAPAPWLAGIARNLANNTIRKRARRQQQPPAHARAPSPTPLDHTLDRERDDLLRATLDELPHAQREALVLYYLEDRSVEQVASGLGVTRDVVKQRLHRAREAVRARLTEHEPALAAWRPSAAFTGAVVAAIATATVTKATAATTSGVPPTVKGTLMLTKIAAAAASVLVAGTALFYIVDKRSEPSASAIREAAASPAPPSPRGAAPPRVGAAGASSSHVGARIGTQHAQLADAIAATRQRRGPAPPARSADGGSSECADGSRECATSYVRDATMAIMPLLKQCVEHKLEEGTIRTHLTIETEPDVGAIVSAATIVEDKTTISDPEIRECIRETMFEIELDPATVSGTLAFETELSFKDDPKP